MDLIQDVLNIWSRYCDEHWLWFGKFDDYQFNYEDKVKYFLERCATFLLLGDSDIMSYDKIKKAYENEVLLSSAGDNVQDLFHSVDKSNVNYSIFKHRFNLFNDTLSLIDYKVKYKPKKQKNKQTTLSKLGNIYKQDDKYVHEIYILKNKDIFPLKNTDWDNKNAKNIVNKNIIDTRAKLIKGHAGLIDKSRPYDCKWAIVDTDGKFEFRSVQYHLPTSISQYQPKEIYFRGKLKDIIYDMDKILCYFQDGNTYFFDQNIQRVLW